MRPGGSGSLPATRRQRLNCFYGLLHFARTERAAPIRGRPSSSSLIRPISRCSQTPSPSMIRRVAEAYPPPRCVFPQWSRRSRFRARLDPTPVAVPRDDGDRRRGRTRRVHGRNGARKRARGLPASRALRSRLDLRLPRRFRLALRTRLAEPTGRHLGSRERRAPVRRRSRGAAARDGRDGSFAPRSRPRHP